MIRHIVLLMALAICLAGCATTKAQWKTAGIDAAKCFAPAVIDSAGDALVALLSQASGDSVDYKSLGLSLIGKYGVAATLCAVGKAYSDLGGAQMLTGEPTKQKVAIAWLIQHQSEWSK